MNQSPNVKVLYKGYVPRGAGKPILLFSTGFLVQEDANPEQCGWYRFKNRFQIGANVDADFCETLNALDAMPSQMDRAYEVVKDACLALQNGIFEPAEEPERYVLFDTQDISFCDDMPLYQFPDALVRPTDPHCLPTLQATQALQILGACNELGVPTQHRAIEIKPGRRRFV